jgi:hypothetical protein
MDHTRGDVASCVLEALEGRAYVVWQVVDLGARLEFENKAREVRREGGRVGTIYLLMRHFGQSVRISKVKVVTGTEFTRNRRVLLCGRSRSSG